MHMMTEKALQILVEDVCQLRTYVVIILYGQFM